MTRTTRAQILERISHTAESAAMHLRVRSALYPALWMCGIVTPVSLVGAFAAEGMAQALFFGVAVIPVVLSGVGFLYFMIKDPDRLQSEDYRIQKQALELIEEKGGKIPVALASVQAIANPRPKALGPGNETEGEAE
jgi:hypothetical protein